MGSALFKVRVESTGEMACNLRLYIIHPDQDRFYATAPFALQVLWDSPQKSGKDANALRQAISMHDISNEHFVYNHIDRFIESVEYIERKNYPRKINFDGMSREELNTYWSNEEKLPQAVIHITVTDSKWIEHLRPDMEWTTSAYNM